MGVRRGSVSLIVNDLLESGLLVEGATGKTVRGRKPTFLYIDSRRRTVIAVDVRASQTFMMLADLLGKPVTWRDAVSHRARCPKLLVEAIAARGGGLLREHGGAGRVRGRRRRGPRDDRTPDDAGAARAAARLAQRRSARAAGGRDRTAGADRELGRACALAQLWAMQSTAVAGVDAAAISCSSPCPTVSASAWSIHGELLRGRHNVAGEFGHVPLSLNGPRCSCGADRLLGSLRLEPRDAGAVLRAQRPNRPSRSGGGAGFHGRGPDCAGPRRRRRRARRRFRRPAGTWAPGWCRS